MTFKGQDDLPCKCAHLDQTEDNRFKLTLKTDELTEKDIGSHEIIVEVYDEEYDTSFNKTVDTFSIKVLPPDVQTLIEDNVKMEEKANQTYVPVKESDCKYDTWRDWISVMIIKDHKNKKKASN